ncbi:MAG TPA: hypothetical protein VM733_10865, partial [Thermoanaerobaculia bacterium]|nr:hypothetical protein [Thermoanaerobaculia bacterium]
MAVKVERYFASRRRFVIVFACFLSFAAAAAPRNECFMLQALDGSAPFVSDAAECAVKTAPASTFKVPHS